MYSKYASSKNQPYADGAVLLTKQEAALRIKSTTRYIERMIAIGDPTA
jgi:hypothetical protein